MLIALTMCGLPVSAGPALKIDGRQESYRLNAHLDADPKEVSPADLAAVQRNYVPQGTPNRLHWYRFSIDNVMGTGTTMLLTNEFPIAQLEVVNAVFPLAPVWGGLRYDDKQYNPRLLPTIQLEIPAGRSDFYLGASGEGHPEVLALLLSAQQPYLTKIKHQATAINIVLGICLGIMIYNMVLFFGANSRLQLSSLAIFLFYVLLSAILRGLFSYLELRGSTWLTAHWLSCLSLGNAAFCWNIIDHFTLKKSDHPFLYRALAALSIVFVGLALFYDLAPALTRAMFLPIGLGASFIFTAAIGHSFKKDPFLSLFFVGGALPPLFILTIIGLVVIGLLPYDLILVDALYYSLVIAAILHGIGIAVRMQRFKTEMALTAQSIHLGRSVQNLLLPKEVQADLANFSYRYVLAPHKDSMSGDWIGIWQDNAGGHCFMLGDVAGKGPQAAIAVAAIATVIDRGKHEGKRIDQILEDINTSLYSLFVGTMNSTVSAVSMRPDGHATLYNGGGLGWIHLQSGVAKHQHLYADWLGGSPFVKIGKMDIQLDPADLLISVTDGVCDGTSSVRMLARKLQSLYHTGATLQTYEQVILSIDNKIADDRAAIMIAGRCSSNEQAVKLLSSA